MQSEVAVIQCESICCGEDTVGTEKHRGGCNPYAHVAVDVWQQCLCIPFIRTNFLLAEFHQKRVLSVIGYTAKKVHLLSRHQIEEDGRQTITSCNTAFWMLWLTPWKQHAVDGRCRTPWPFDCVVELPNTPVLLLPLSSKGPVPARLSSQSGNV
jgi:hypothetical protein